MLVVFLFV